MKSISLLIVSLLSACSSQVMHTSHPDKKVSDLLDNLSDNSQASILLHEYMAWEGTPYLYGGSTLTGVDCSGFVQSVFLRAHQISLPRTTLAQSNIGYQVKYEEAESGDLVFFKTSAKNKHVGIYLGEKQFMHASTSKGVTMSRLDNPYWASVFWQLRRID